MDYRVVLKNLPHFFLVLNWQSTCLSYSFLCTKLQQPCVLNGSPMLRFSSVYHLNILEFYCTRLRIFIFSRFRNVLKRVMFQINYDGSDKTTCN